jgi:7-cyano-7-deazaguanine synthase
MEPKKAVLITSGGLDSTVMAYQYHAQNYQLTMVAFDYGQRHHKELDYALGTAEDLGAQFHLIALHDLADILAVHSKSVLVNKSKKVPDGHYAEETMKQTVVPNRNMVMLAIAGSVAVAKGADVLGLGVHAGDHFIYPDCRPGFIDAMARALVLGNEGFGSASFALQAPFLTLSKATIVSIGHRLRVPWDKTWSCYKGGDIHCGRCATCVERIEAFALADIDDPTKYEDRGYALEVVGR